MAFPTWKFPSIFIQAIEMAAFLFSLSVDKAHSLTSVENLRQNPRISSWKLFFDESQSKYFAKSSLSLVDFTRGDSRRFERSIPSISLALCLENIHEVSSSSWSSSRVFEACFFCFAHLHFSQTVSKINSIPHGAIFAFPRMRKTYGVLRIADFLLSYYFPYKNWNHRLKYCQSNQKKIPRMHPPCL